MGIEIKECPVCNKVFEILPQKCDNCGYDFSLSSPEVKKLKEDHNIMVSDISEAGRRLRTAGIVLFATGLANILLSVFYYFEVDNIVFISGSASGIITLLCFLFIKTKPVVAIIIPMVINIGFNLIQMIFTFSYYSHLITVNIVLLAILIYNLRSMIIVERIRKRYNKKIIKSI